jgi:hypothetical protein
MFRDWCLGQGMGIKTVKRVFASVRAIINLAISEEGLIVLMPLQRRISLMMIMPNQDSPSQQKTSRGCNNYAKNLMMK